MSVQICKSGCVKADQFVNTIVNTYNSTGYTEPDGSVWVRVAHHNQPANALFTKGDFSKPFYLDDNRWFNVSLCNYNTTGKWELMYKQKQTKNSDEEKYRFIQSANPMKATFEQTKAANITKITNGYTASGSSYGGVHMLNGPTYLVGNNGTNGNWFGAIGCWSKWNDGLPGYNGVCISTGYIDLYYRVDNIGIGIFELFDNKIIADNFIEN